MVRYCAEIAYDGTDFEGFQRQPNKRTVQGELERVLQRLNSCQPVQVHGAGRTDAGVHALEQVIHFDLAHERDEEKLRYALDTQLPMDISCLHVEQVPDTFHAQYQPHHKRYRYYVYTNRAQQPIRERYATHFPYALDIDAMRVAAKQLEGTHDFTTFCATGSSVEDKVRTIDRITITADEAQQLVTFEYEGNGFLYKMVRLMTGTLLRLGNGRLDQSITELLEAKDQQQTLWAAPAKGLFLVHVDYDND